jgi:hypothetical protein
LVHRHDGLVGVVVLVCLARVVFVGGVDPPRNVFAIPVFADDDENVVHLTLLSALVGLWAEPRDRVDDDGVRGVAKVEVASLSKEKVRNSFWDTITQVRVDLARVPRKWLPLFCA